MEIILVVYSGKIGGPKKKMLIFRVFVYDRRAGNLGVEDAKMDGH